MPTPKPIKALIDELVPPAEVDSATDPLAARKKAMDYLARREYAGQELSAKLARAGFDADVAEGVVAELAAEGLQSDDRFLEAFVHARVRQGKGPVRIRAELAERGIPGAAADVALAASGEDWRALAAAVRRRKFGSAAPAAYPEKARQMRFLQYRGFETDQIQAALDDSGETLF